MEPFLETAILPLDVARMLRSQQRLNPSSKATGRSAAKMPDVDGIGTLLDFK
jgi:hypothetical protein